MAEPAARQRPRGPAGDLLRRDVLLAERTTLEIGGAARWWARVEEPATLGELVRWAGAQGLPLTILGGGSNLLVADGGFDGLVIELGWKGVDVERQPGGARLRVGAGVPWDALVATTVEAGLGGLECLSGIPGRVGAAPIQNIGAYGQEVAEHLHAVEVFDLERGRVERLLASDCGFGYRWSHFKGAWRGRYVVLGVELELPATEIGTVRYRDLEKRFELAPGDPRPSVAAVREAVLEVRRSKSMVLDPEDPNRRSAGSFFVNPVVDPAMAAEALRRFREAGGEGEMPAYPAAEGRTKLAAAWLIERAGFERGHRQGRVGLSSRHTLALINRGGATARELLGLAATIRTGVRERFGVSLEPEPVFLGFDAPVEELLDDPSRA